DLKLNTTSAMTLAMTVNGSEVSLVRGNVVRADAQTLQRQFQFLLQQFKQLDKNGKGVTLDQVKEPQFQPLKAIFLIADRDGNETLTEKELQGYMDMVAAATGAQVNLTFSDNGQGL